MQTSGDVYKTISRVGSGLFISIVVDVSSASSFCQFFKKRSYKLILFFLLPLFSNFLTRFHVCVCVFWLLSLWLLLIRLKGRNLAITICFHVVRRRLCSFQLRNRERERERLFSTSVGVDSTKDEILFFFFFFFFYIYLFSNKKKEIYMHICTRRGSFSLSVSQSGSIYRTNHGTQILMIKQFECIAASYVRVSLLFNSVTHSSECGQRDPAVSEMINIITRSQV